MSADDYGYDTADIPGTPTEKRTLARCQYLLKVAKQPDKRWRKRAIEGVKFYFDDQWESDAKQKVEARGQTAVVVNGIKPVTRVMLGLMLAQPMDWQAKPVGQHDDDKAEAAEAALKYVGAASKQTIVNQRAYLWGLTYGRGCAFVYPNAVTRDPSAEKCQVRHVDPREVRVDAEFEPGLSPLKVLVWSRKVDVEEAKRLYPKTDFSGQEDAGEDPNLTDKNGIDAAGIKVSQSVPGVTPPPSLWEQYDSWNQFGEDADKANKQVIIHTLWEVRYEPVWFYEGADEQPTRFKRTDTRAALLMNPAVKKVYKDEGPVVYKSIFCGPLLLEHGPDDRNHHRIPWAIWDFERDQHGDPVSFVESLKQIQREVNYRRAKMLHSLGNPPIRVSPSVLSLNNMTHDQFAAHIVKPGAVILAEDGQIEVIRRDDQASQQYELMQHGENQIQKGSGANDNLMGYEQGGASNVSGKSKELSMQQGATMQRDAETNLREWHKAVGELLLCDIQQEHTGPWLVRVTDDQGKDAWLELNSPQVDPQTGLLSITRDLDACRFEIEVENSPWSPTQRQRAADQLNAMAADEQDPILRHTFLMAALQVSDYPNKNQIMQDIAKAQQQSQQTPPPAPRLEEQVRLAGTDLTPYEIGQTIQKMGLQPDPSRQPGQPSTAQAGIQAKTQGGQQAPPSLDPNKALEVGGRIKVAQMKHEHDALQGAAARQHEHTLASIGRTHDEILGVGQQSHDHEMSARAHQQGLMAGLAQHQQGLASGLMQHAMSLDQQQQAAELAPPPTSGGSTDAP